MGPQKGCIGIYWGVDVVQGITHGPLVWALSFLKGACFLSVCNGVVMVHRDSKSGARARTIGST